MNFAAPIRIRSRLACTVRPAELVKDGVSAIAEELSRNSVIILTRIDPTAVWIQPGSKVVITVDLPFRGNFTPRALEVTAVINQVSLNGAYLRVAAVVRGMAFVSRDWPLSEPVLLN